MTEVRDLINKYESEGYYLDETMYTEGVAYYYMRNEDTYLSLTIKDNFLHGVTVEHHVS